MWNLFSMKREFCSMNSTLLILSHFYLFICLTCFWHGGAVLYIKVLHRSLISKLKMLYFPCLYACLPTIWLCGLFHTSLLNVKVLLPLALPSALFEFGRWTSWIAVCQQLLLYWDARHSLWRVFLRAVVSGGKTRHDTNVMKNFSEWIFVHVSLMSSEQTFPSGISIYKILSTSKV